MIICFSCLDGSDQLKKWVELMLQDPAVKATIHSTDNHKAFYQSFISGKADYDYGLWAPQWQFGGNDYFW